MAVTQPADGDATELDERALRVLSLVPEPVFVVAVEHTPHFRFLYGNDAFRELVAWPEDEPVAVPE